MKESYLLLVALGVLWLLSQSQTTKGGSSTVPSVGTTSTTGYPSGGIEWISCDSPYADPIFCGFLGY